MNAQQRQQLEAAIGPYLSSAANPCAVEFYHDETGEKPWRIADDHASESYATFGELLAAAAAWRQAFDDDAEFDAAQERLGP